MSPQRQNKKLKLVGGLEHEWMMTFHAVGNGIIIPTDVHSIIFQRGRSTTNHDSGSEQRSDGGFSDFTMAELVFMCFPAYLLGP